MRFLKMNTQNSPGVLKSLDSALMVRSGEVIKHPVFGRVRVEGIYPHGNGDYDAFCVLEDFNDTHKVFDLLPLSRLKFKQPTLKAVT